MKFNEDFRSGSLMCLRGLTNGRTERACSMTFGWRSWYEVRPLVEEAITADSWEKIRWNWRSPGSSHNLPRCCARLRLLPSGVSVCVFDYGVPTMLYACTLSRGIRIYDPRCSVYSTTIRLVVGAPDPGRDQHRGIIAINAAHRKVREGLTLCIPSVSV